MTSALDVAAFVLDELGDVSTMKLQKLVYYSQAWCLVKHGSPLFPEPIEAWVNGPVIPQLYEAHKGQFVVSREDMRFPWVPASLDAREAGMVRRVLSVLGGWSGSDLSRLTHAEKPWKDARAGLKPTDRSHNRIDAKAIATFYASSECTNPLFA